MGCDCLNCDLGDLGDGVDFLWGDVGRAGMGGDGLDCDLGDFGGGGVGGLDVI